ncbi:MAG: 16S rRNA (adenine(1518)-N(6)/adenine(1519)-N(6))-dimethyltransferase RsmA [Clostridia bacterium]
MDSLKITKEILNKYDIRAKKAYGQNFLIDDNVLKQIASLANINDKDLIIEIGPGLGNLTYYLKDSNLLLVEIDEKMIEILKDRFLDNDNIKIINKDILKIDIDLEIEKLEKEKNIKFENIKVVANLPYYITSPIIFKLLEDSKKVKEIIVMVQEEVADRIASKSKSKDYGVLTVMINYYAKSNKEITVESSSFIPSPNVTSAVVKIIKEDKYENINNEIFRELIHKSFANRRKKLSNSLVNNNLLGLSKEEIIKILTECNITSNARAEELDIDKYIQIAEKLNK